MEHHDASQLAEAPLGYAVAATALTAVSTFAIRRAAWKHAAERMRFTDRLLLGFATRRATKFVTEDPMTRGIRDAFLGPRSARGEKWRVALSELVTSPRCATMWTGTMLSVGLALVPRTTRVVCVALTALAVHDFVRAHTN